jgi:hypothetical protein
VKQTGFSNSRRILLSSLAVGLFSFPGLALSPCDLTKDGSVNVTDVTLGVNMVLGLSSCTANITGTGGCNVAMVQRVVGAALPNGSCHPTILSWAASPSPNVSGYNIYRGTSSTGPFTKLNTTLLKTTTYTDGTSQPGLTYFYVATAVDSSNNESAFSSPAAQAVIPTP